LSYTTFAYSRFSVTRSGDILVAKLDVRNSGTRAGDEVVQLYQRSAGAVAPQASMRLLAFARLRLAPGQSRSVELTVPLANLALWDTARNDYVTAPGAYQIEAGASSTDIRQRTTVTIA
jgi:beta-glucosidase